MNFVIALIILHFLLFVYTFRFQRTTLSLSRDHLGEGLARYQTILTPNWMGLLGWLQTSLYVVAIILVFLTYGWLYALGYVLISQAGYSLFDAITPFPSYEYCFKIIKNHLVKEVQLAHDEKIKGGLQKVLMQVIASERKIGK